MALEKTSPEKTSEMIFDSEELIFRPTAEAIKAEIKALKNDIKELRPKLEFTSRAKFILTLDSMLRLIEKMARADRSGKFGIRTYMSEMAKAKELIKLLKE